MLEPSLEEFIPDKRLHITLPFQGRWARKVFVRGLGLPRAWVYSVLRAIKTCLMPGEVRMRRRAAERLIVDEPDLEAWHRAGYRPAGDSALSDLAAVLAPCREIQQRVSSQKIAHATQAKSFLNRIAANEDFLAYPAVIQVVLSEQILCSVSAY